jgi:hypothetical protein
VNYLGRWKIEIASHALSPPLKYSGICDHARVAERRISSSLPGDKIIRRLKMRCGMLGRCRPHRRIKSFSRRICNNKFYRCKTVSCGSRSIFNVCLGPLGIESHGAVALQVVIGITEMKLGGCSGITLWSPIGKSFH